MKNKMRLPAMILALALLCGLLPSAAAAAPDGAEDGIPAALADIARQLQDPNRDPFAFETVPAPRRGLLRAAAPYPAAFDLRHVDSDGDRVADACYVTPVKNQGNLGNCWGFAAIASAETSILSSGLAAEQGLVYAVTPDTPAGLEALDLSEKHVAYFFLQAIDDPADPQNGEGYTYNGTPGDWGEYFGGGLPFYATGLFACGTGPVTEFGYVYDTESDTWIQPFAYRGKEGKIAYAGGGPYSYSINDDWSIPGEYRWYQSYVLKESYLLPTPSGKEGAEKTAAINAIKEQVYAGRSVQTGLCADGSAPGEDFATYFISPNWAHYTYDPNAGANHAVAIIGWDDNYPRENFAHKTKNGEAPLPAENGAWLVKNSWGSHEEEFPNRGYENNPWGLLQGQDRGIYNETTGKWEYKAVEGAVNTGYFWLSYEDESMCLIEALDFDAANVEEGYYLYQYDFMPVSDVSAATEPFTLRMANVFTAGADGIIDRVSCQTTTPGTHVRYEVYLLDADAETPMDGVVVASAEADYAYGGFHKAKLDRPTLLREGQRFAVVVTQVTPAGNYCLSMQSSYKSDPWEVRQIKGVINVGESLFYIEGHGWYDLADEQSKKRLFGESLEWSEVDNFPIKAYLALPGGAEEGPAAPEADSLTYNGQAQALLTMPKALPAGYAKAQFSMDGGVSWSDKIPTGTHAGTYPVLVKYVGGAGYADFFEAPISVVIEPAALTIQARNRSVTVGEPVPPWDAGSYTVSGLLGDDTLDAAPAVRYERGGAAVTVDTSRTGVYDIVPYGAAAADYEIRYRSGRLRVSASGGGDVPPAPVDDTPPVKQEPPRSTPAFTDVDAGAWYASAVAWAVENGITQGTDESHFSPDLQCTRGQIVTFLWRAAGCPEPGAGAPSFTDVAPGSDYEAAVRWASAAGITTGVDGQRFDPDAPVSRAQAVTFLYRAFGGAAGTDAGFADVDPAAWYAPAVAWAAGKGVALGVGAGRFAPENLCTRAQIVTFLYRCAG